MTPYSPSSNQFMDTRSEPGLSDVPSTPIATDSPGLPPISPTFRRTPREPFQTTAQPQVPSFPSILESSFGHGKLVPLAPKNPVLEPLDAGSDDRMELDFEEPIARVYNPSGIKPSGGPSGDSTAIPGAKDREPEATISNNRSMKRKRRISEIDRMIEKLTSEKDKLVYEEQVEFNRGNYPTQSQRASQDSQAVVSGPNGPNSKRIALGRIEENDQDHDMRGGNEPGVLPDSERSGTSHALRGYIQQATTQDPWPGRWLNPSTDPHSPDAADKDRASALSPQGTMTVSSPTGTTAATEVSQQPHPAEGRLRLSPPLAMGLRAQRGAIPNKQASSKYTGNAAQLRLGPGPSSGLQKGPATCLVCAKTFHRPSELKKHMKRHSRPFACTFRGCGKSFGSKNDWKRHENSQHFQLELWKCGVIAPKSTGLCGKLSFRRESHITHLKNAHNIIDKQEIQKWTNEAHIGRNNFKTFWCGFCPKERGGLIIKGCVVQLKKKGLDGWDERFDHLGKHFEEGNHIKDYTFHEDDVFGDLHSTEEDEDEDDEVDDIREEDDNTGEERPIIESTAPPEEEKAEKLQPSQLATTQKDEKGNKKDKRWYCCNQNIGRCSDPGPYTVGLTDSCIQCCHERCKACSIEERG
ncbi:hypothetical protein B9Z19DRAFT_1099322 [Tuber borchii]|uniref:C2H2-type domain-containing protein n=1 Tax=Tuber borchii TaxID=42251 RepID=A0A2T7A3C3_TUBBO|nr:hypothetical protein B9Z19DRAFT_1099322 [Tuber borchii]